MRTEEMRLGGKDLEAKFSLLYPPGEGSDRLYSFLELSSATAHDLGVDDIVAAFTVHREHQMEVRRLFALLPCDPDTISYRQTVLCDLLANPELVEKFASLLPVIDSLFEYSYRPEPEMRYLNEVVWRMGELQNIIDCLEGFREVFDTAGDKIKSDGLRMLREEIRKAQKEESYQNLARELPLLLSQLRGCASVTVGINLDASLRPIQATLLSANDRPFTGQSLLNRLFGIRRDQEGIGPLHSVPQRTVEGPYPFPVSSDLGWAVEPMLVPLFADLARVLEKAAKPIADQLSKYADIHAGLLVDLRQALILYLGAVRFVRHFQELGLPMCAPRMVAAAERVCEVKDSYNVHLGLKYSATENGEVPEITMNDVIVGPDRQILILTGPNHGGKTTYTQGVGIVHILAQIGCLVPGRQATISPLDHLFTHFPLEEKPDSEAGRLGEEAVRLREIFEQLTRHTLVLLNESLSSTSFSESLYLAQDIVRILRKVGARAIYSTHLHELASRVTELNGSVPGDSTIVSVVSSPMDTGVQKTGRELTRTYKVEMRPPLGQSYAREIAARYGISYQQLEEFLSARGVL